MDIFARFQENNLSFKIHTLDLIKQLFLWFKMAHLSLDKRAISNKMGFHNLGA